MLYWILFCLSIFYALRTAHLRIFIRLQPAVRIKTIRNSRLAACGVSYASTIEARAGTGIGESKDVRLKSMPSLLPSERKQKLFNLDAASAPVDRPTNFSDSSFGRD